MANTYDIADFAKDCRFLREVRDSGVPVEQTNVDNLPTKRRLLGIQFERLYVPSNGGSGNRLPLAECGQDRIHQVFVQTYHAIPRRLRAYQETVTAELKQVSSSAPSAGFAGDLAEAPCDCLCSRGPMHPGIRQGSLERELAFVERQLEDLL